MDQVLFRVRNTSWILGMEYLSRKSSQCGLKGEGGTGRAKRKQTELCGHCGQMKGLLLLS